MYIFIENNNTKNGKKERRKKKKRENWVGLEPCTFCSTRVRLTATPQRLITYPGERVFNLMPFPWMPCFVLLIGRRLAAAQVSVRIGKGRKILRLYYPYGILTSSVITVVQKATFKCSVSCNTVGCINPELPSFFNFHDHPSICFYAASFLALKTFYRIKCKSSVGKFIHIFEHSDSDYTFLAMFLGCRTSNLTAGVTGHRYVWGALWPM